MSAEKGEQEQAPLEAEVEAPREGAVPRIQPVLVGLALAAIIVAISLGTFWPR